MHVSTIRKPGEPGTQKLVAKYGERLVAVRFRNCPIKGKRYKTIELIIAEEDWAPPPDRDTEIERLSAQQQKPIYTERVPVKIHYTEKELRQTVKSIGGIWDPAQRVWLAPAEYIHRVGLADRIVR